jgi:competence protein ComEA
MSIFKSILAAAAILCSTGVMAAIDVNKASEADLDGVKGLGPGTTRLILAERKKSEFKDWPDLIARVKGIGEPKAARLSAQGLTVGSAPYKPVAAAGAPDKRPAGTAVAKAPSPGNTEGRKQP